MSDPRWTDETEAMTCEVLEAFAYDGPIPGANFNGRDAERAAERVLEALADSGLLMPPDATVEHGYRHRISDAHQWSEVAVVGRAEQAAQIAADISHTTRGEGQAVSRVISPWREVQP